MQKASKPMLRVGNGVTAPKVIYQQDPILSDEARHAKYQGTCVLWLVVDSAGRVRDVRVSRPLGVGLDQKAVDAILKWQFLPSRKDGEPVSIEIAVMVEFHLY
ncbi:MAG TPA: energy transducer TonB [Candidatus Sulfotelmatobacter sp.]